MEKAPFFVEVSEGPRNAQAFWTKTEDDFRIRLVHWPSTSQSSGTIFVFQGRTENLEKYGRAALEFQNAGYDTLALDWRGQGLSQRLSDDSMVGHVNQYADYHKDVAAVLRAAEVLAVPKPWFLFGHSLGGCVGLGALMQGMPVQASAFTAPLWDVKLSSIQRALAWPLSWAAQVFGKADTYAPGTRGESYVLNTGFEENRLTHDPEMYRYYQRISEELVDQQIGGPSLGWLFQTLKETAHLSKLPSPQNPCLTLCGEEDTVVSLAAVEDRMKRWENGEFSLVKNARHDVLYESTNIRKSVFRSILSHFANSSRLH